jgi:RND family efflux transporter MFP subunit
MIVDQPREAETPERGKTTTSRGPWAVLLITAAALCAALGAIVVSGIRGRAASLESLTRTTEQAAVATVNVVKPQPGGAVQEVVLPGTARAFMDSSIYARTNGYLTKWYFDIGARVKKGDLLAEIETPEIDQQLQQARADLETTQANYRLAQTTSDRWQFLLKSNSVSRQEADQTLANMAAQKAAVAAQTANVHRLEQLQSFEKVYAPFDGVITARNTDIGALIDAGSGSQTRELFHLADISKVRVFVAVPEAYSAAARAGASATLALQEYPGRRFTGELTRHTNAIDPTSRTLLVEVDVDNPGGLIMPGAYVSLHLKLPGSVRALTLPANALMFRKEGLNVAVVRNGAAVLTPVTIGRDYGDRVEVLSGLDAGQPVILDPADSLVTGTSVHVAGDSAR